MVLTSIDNIIYGRAQIEIEYNSLIFKQNTAHKNMEKSGKICYECHLVSCIEGLPC